MGGSLWADAEDNLFSAHTSKSVAAEIQDNSPLVFKVSFYFPFLRMKESEKTLEEPQLQFDSSDPHSDTGLNFKFNWLHNFVTITKKIEWNLSEAQFLPL